VVRRGATLTTDLDRYEARASGPLSATIAGDISYGVLPGTTDFLMVFSTRPRGCGFRAVARPTPRSQSDPVCIRSARTQGQLVTDFARNPIR